MEGPMAAPKAHALLAATLLLPAVLHVPYALNIVLHAAVTVYAGAWRSVRTTGPVETMTSRDAARFPLVGSAVLVSLFLAFRYLPKDWINAVLALYLVAMGVLAVVAVALPFAEKAFPPRLRAAVVTLRVSRLPRVPLLLPEPEDLVLTLPTKRIV